MSDEYLRRWRALGLDTPADFPGDDEHVRYGIFSDWISCQQLNKEQVEDLVSLIELEPDVNLQMSFYVLMIRYAADNTLPRLLAIESQRPFVEEEIALRRLDHETSEADQLQLQRSHRKKSRKSFWTSALIHRWRRYYRSKG